jgi:GNAT superfamily N-acetyltransferase
MDVERRWAEPRIDRAALIARISRTWAENAAAHARVLAAQDPSWGTEVFDVGGGVAVLCGHGLYVNRALAVGLGATVTADDFDLLEARSAAVGVPSAVELVPTTDPTVLALAAARGYGVQRFITTDVLPLEREPLPLVPEPVQDLGVVVDVAGGDQLAEWQDVAACGFGVAEGESRRASDVFALASAALDGCRLVLARDAGDGRPLGCASLTISDGLATLGAMTTLPAERRRGVQLALIAHRLRVAVGAGCDLAASSSIPANASERNLLRAGFRPLYETVTIARAPRERGSS